MSKKAEKVTLGKEQVWVANGAGNQPKAVAWQKGDTVGTILERCGIELAEGRTATLGQRRVHSMATPVEPGMTIVIAGMPCNG